jgi:hypothetical protein
MYTEATIAIATGTAAIVACAFPPPNVPGITNGFLLELMGTSIIAFYGPIQPR